MTTQGCHNRYVVKRIEATSQAVLLNDLKRVRTAAIEHARAGQELARERRRLIEALLAEGFSQADLARELGVTRQAIQKMVAVGKVSAVTEMSHWRSGNASRRAGRTEL
jgi:DNA-binding XRE family transcriptional regulator